jgi:hypothetical protein
VPRRFSIVFTLVALAGLLLSACAVQQEQPKEEAAEEAGVEEVAEPAEPSPEEIQAEGCPEGQISNEAGTECYPIEEHERAQEQIDRAIAEQQARERIRKYESGELLSSNRPAETLYVECQMDKALLDGGPERVDEIMAPVAEQFERATEDNRAGRTPEPQEGPTLRERFAQEGYECQEPTAPPTPAELDKKYEKPADNPKQREVQCGPQSNASPEFREKYC